MESPFIVYEKRAPSESRRIRFAAAAALSAAFLALVALVVSTSRQAPVDVAEKKFTVLAKKDPKRAANMAKDLFGEGPGHVKSNKDFFEPADESDYGITNSMDDDSFDEVHRYVRDKTKNGKPKESFDSPSFLDDLNNQAQKIPNRFNGKSIKP